MEENIDEKYMKEALGEAKKALEEEEIPVGCIIVQNGKIIARAHNKKEKEQDPTAHAEILAIKEACKKNKNWRLTNAKMYVTLEPCIMCTGAILQSRLEKVYIGKMNPRLGYCGSVRNLLEDNPNDYKIPCKTNILEDEEQKLLDVFFTNLRNKKNKK